MNFLNPLGLIGLIGVPILIIVYIIKSKYTEQTVSSTYLWTLSEKFLKRRNPFSKLTGIIGFILQLMTVILIALAIAHPILIIPGAAKEYCFILDSSGSMNIAQDGVTRFEKGKEEIKSIIEDSSDGSLFTLILADKTTTVAFEREDSVEEALSVIDDLTPGHLAIDGKDALSYAQSVFDINRSAKTYFVTDKEYQTHSNVEIINLSNHESNYAVESINEPIVASDGTMTVTGTVVSYENDALLTVELYLNGIETAVASTHVEASKLASTPYSLSCVATGYDEVKVKISTPDALSLDSEQILYNVSKENAFRTLIVSEKPFFIKSAIETSVNADVIVMSPQEYTGQTGYGLYVFDSYSPEKLPQDGSVWIFNPVSSIEKSGFTVQGTIELERSAVLGISDSTSSVVKTLTENMVGSDVGIKKYVQCGTYRKFTTIYSYNKYTPIVFTGVNDYGNREIVFAFDIKDSNFVATFDYVVLIGNMMKFSFPTVIDEVSYYCGDEANINVVANCETISVKAPSGKEFDVSTGEAIASFMLDEVGEYEVNMMVAGTNRVYNIYSALSEEERLTTASAEDFSLFGEASDKGFDGKYDNIMILFIILGVIFAADWAVYCYDKYQLR